VLICRGQEGDAMDLSQQLLSPDSLKTFGGLSFAVACVANTVKAVFSITAPWVAFAAAELLCLGTAIAQSLSPLDIGIAALNGCVIFSCAAGMNAVGTVSARKIGRPGEGPPGIAGEANRQAPFFAPWFAK